MSKKFIFAGIAGAAVIGGGIFISQYTKSLDTEKPDQLAKDPAIEGVESVIGAPVYVKASDVEALLRQQFPGQELFRESGRRVNNKTTLQTILNKRAEPTVRAEGNALVLRMPVQADIRVDWEYEKRIDLIVGSTSVSVKTHKDTNVQFTVIAKITPKINPDYSVSAGLDLNYTLDRGAQIKVGPIEINLVSKVREALDGQMNRFRPKVAGLIENKINLKPYAQKAWSVFEKPYVIDQKLGAYAWADPQKFEAIPFRTENGAFIMGVGLRGRFYAAVQDQAPKITTKPLPDFSTAPVGDDFALNFPVRVNYDRITDTLNDKFIGERIDLDGHAVEFKKFSIFGGAKGQLVVGARILFDGEGDFFDTQGWVYMLGDPSYDKETQTVSIKNLDYDVQTRNTLINALTWAANPFVIKKIQSELEYSLTKDLEKLKAQAEQYKQQELSEGVTLKTELSTIDLEGFYIGNQSMTLNIVSNGKASVQLSGPALK